MRLLFWLLPVVVALYEDAESVETFESVSDFDEKVMADDSNAWIITLYTSKECESCAMIESDFAKASEELAATLGLRSAAVDVSAGDGIKIAKRLGSVDRVPAVVGVGSATSMNPYTKKPHRDVLPWLDMFKDNTFSVSSLKRWVGSKILPNVPRGPDAVKEQKLPVAILVTERTTTSSLAKSLALSLRGRLALVEIHKDDATEYMTPEDEELPKLLIKDEAYDGDLKDRGAVLAWLEARALSKDEKISSDTAAPPKKEEEEPEETEELFGPTYTGSTVATMEEVTTRLQREEAAVIVAPADAVPSDATKTIGKKLGDLDGSGTVKAYVCGDCELWRAYGFGTSAKMAPLGVFEDPELAYNAAAATVPGADVAIIGGLQLDAFMQRSLTSPDIPKAGIIVFSAKDEVSIHVKALGKVLAATTGVPVAQIVVTPDQDQELLARFQVPKIPWVLAFHAQLPPENEEQPPPGSVSLGIAHFDRKAFGPPVFKSLVTFAGFLLQQLDPDAAMALQDHVLEDASASARAQPKPSTQQKAKKTKPGTVADLNSLGLDEGCDQQLCAIFMLDPRADRHAADVAIASDVALAEASGPFGFGWLDAGCHPEVAAAFDVDASKLPTLVAFARRKQRFAFYVGHFNAKDLKSFLRGVPTGRTPTQPLRTDLPAIETDRGCFDLPLEESTEDDTSEESGLDDDLMAEILAEEAAEKKRINDELKADKLRHDEEQKRLKDEEAAKAAKAAKKKKAAAKKKKAAKKKASSSDL